MKHTLGTLISHQHPHIEIISMLDYFLIKLVFKYKIPDIVIIIIIIIINVIVQNTKIHGYFILF